VVETLKKQVNVSKLEKQMHTSNHKTASVMYWLACSPRAW